MSRTKLADWSHPILGTFARSTVTNHRNETFFDLEKKGPTIVASLGVTFYSFEISLLEVSEPPPDMLSDLIAMVEWPKERVHEIEDQVLSYYQENRTRFIEEHEMNHYSANEIARRVPLITQRDQVWQLLGEPLGIHGGNLAIWDDTSISFQCIFDEEHELQISFSKGGVDRVWNE